MKFIVGASWFLPDWKRDLALLGDMHRKLRAAVATLDDAALESIPPGSKTTMLDLLLGVVAHDLYHAGQIQMIKRMRQDD